MLKQIIYITGNNRSGSTMLDFLLGEHPLICSLGELHHLHNYISGNVAYYAGSNQLVCSCGKKVCDCIFWKKIEKTMDKLLIDLNLVLDPTRNLKQEINLKWFFNKKNLVILKNKLISKTINRYPVFLNSKSIFTLTGYRQIAIDHFKLCEVVSQVKQKTYVVDSSKTPHRFKYLSMLNKDKVVIIHLVRNPAAVVYSIMKRGTSIEKAIDEWITKEKKISLLLLNISKDKKIFVRYEDLCEFPEKTLLFICNKLGIKYNSAMINLTLVNKHHIRGSSSKFKYDGKIMFDKKFTEHLSQNQLDYIMRKTMPFSKRYGYYSKA